MLLGTVSAGCYAVIVIFQFSKAILNIIVHGYTLHSVYGWSIRLLGALFSSVTHLLIHLNNQPPAEPPVQPPVELNEIRGVQEPNSSNEKLQDPAAPSAPIYYPSLQNKDENDVHPKPFFALGK